MNILVIPSWYGTKVNPTNGSFFKEQALALKEKGHNVIIAFVEVTLEKLSNEDKKVQYYIDEGLKTYRIKENKIRKTGNIGTSMAIKRGIIKIYNELTKNDKIDIIHLHSCVWAGAGAVAIKKKANVPLVITEHSSFYARYKVNIFEDFLIKYITKNSNYMICVSNTLKNIMLKYTDSIDVIPNMVDCDKFKLNNINLEDKFIFLTVSYLKDNKNVDVLIKAFKKALDHIDAKLIIGGKGPEEEKLKKLCADLGISDKVEFKGALSRAEVPEVINSCNVFVLASKFETFGVVLIEALSSGKPVISTKNGGAQDIVNSNNGFLVDVDSVSQLGDAIIKMKENYSKYNSADISRECKDKYNKTNIATRIEEVYKKLLHNK